MTNLQMWALISGFLLPPVEAVIQQSHWRRSFRSVVNFLLCCIVAFVVVYLKGDTDFHSWVKVGLTVLVTAIASYHGMWQHTVAPTIEKKTNAAVTSVTTPTPPRTTP
jgi:uncharacterized membrane protein YqaE (UPF0057 family)